MADVAFGVDSEAQALWMEIGRLNKIIRALMDRAERSTNLQGSDFSLFQRAVMLEDQVHSRTAEVEAVLRENERITRALRESEAKFRGVVSQSMVGIALIEDGRFTYANPKCGEIFGYSTDELRALRPYDLAVEGDRCLVGEQMRRRVSGEVNNVEYVSRMRRKDGAVVDVAVQSSATDIDGKLVLISLIMDVTDRTRAEREIQTLQQRLREEAIHDALTGLYNRRYLEETLDREMMLAEHEGHPISAIMSDLDNFKTVNDEYGHLAGDEVLRVFGELTKRYCRGNDIYCRYGGEEFLLLLPDMTAQAAYLRAEQLRKKIIATSVKFRAKPIAFTASFGVAEFPQHARTGDELIAAADRALYTAKERGRNQVRIA